MFLVTIALFAASLPANIPLRSTGACTWVRGRFNVWNGSGVRRIWVIGTHRLLALRDSDDSVPKAIDDYVSSGPYVLKADGLYGDFKVCALEPRRLRQMQHVRVIAVRRLTFRGAPFRPRADAH